MARLDDLLPELRSTNPIKVETSTKSVNKVISGMKRRAWLDPNEKPELDINKTLTENIDIKDENKGFMNAVYKPDCLCFADLRSNPLRLFHFLYELIKNNGKSFSTPRVKLREIMIQLDISKDSARTALRFLLKQKFIERIEFQPGQLGWSRYELKEAICKELEESLSKGSISPFVANVLREPNKETSSFIDPWDDIDISPVEFVGFRKKHLLQVKKDLTPEIVQESIYHFGYALKHNPKIKEYASPLSAFISVLKRGEAWIESDYKSPQEIAQQKFIELKKAELERVKNLEEEFFKVALEEWQQTLSPQEIESFAPDNRKRGDPIPPKAKLITYFKENIWPSMKQSYLELKN